jgi:hypothetical protein
MDRGGAFTVGPYPAGEYSIRIRSGESEEWSGIVSVVSGGVANLGALSLGGKLCNVSVGIKNMGPGGVMRLINHVGSIRQSAVYGVESHIEFIGIPSDEYFVQAGTDEEGWISRPLRLTEREQHISIGADVGWGKIVVPTGRLRGEMRRMQVRIHDHTGATVVQTAFEEVGRPDSQKRFAVPVGDYEVECRGAVGGVAKGRVQVTERAPVRVEITLQ